LIVIPVVYSVFVGARDRSTRRGPDEAEPIAERPAPRAPEPVGAQPAPQPAAPATVTSTALPRPPATVGGPLTAVQRFRTRAEAEGAWSYLAAAGLQPDRLVVRPGQTSSGRSGLTRLAAGWLRRRQPDLLASDHAWELAAPPAVAATARTVLAGNGHMAVDQYFATRG
jgi:hypothetical protein